ncbi:hypothetical protein Leryth_011502 [Lithospermum erythrorhizon]|nr:hypothetical protein Leryth_011502 [Lithospermum erythrorhizon]
MHNPICFFPFRSSTFVKHQGLLHANQDSSSIDLFIFACCLPISSFSCSWQTLISGFLEFDESGLHNIGGVVIH